MSEGYLDADFNHDGIVDGLDFNIWGENFGTLEGATNADGDADGDGAVTGSDYMIWQQQYNQEQVPNIPGGRLSLDPNDSTPDDIEDGTHIYFVPHQGAIHEGSIFLWDGNEYVEVEIDGMSLPRQDAMTTDVFAYLAGPETPALEALTWTEYNVRHCELTYEDGLYYKATDKTRLYLGTYRTRPGNEFIDTRVSRYVFNAYNRVPRQIQLQDTDCSVTVWPPGWHTIAIDGRLMIDIVDSGLGQVFVDACISARASVHKHGTQGTGTYIGRIGLALPGSDDPAIENSVLLESTSGEATYDSYEASLTGFAPTVTGLIPKATILTPGTEIKIVGTESFPLELNGYCLM